MTERFVVPEPSKEAMYAFADVFTLAEIRPIEIRAVRAAFATDLPAIVRVEVAAALMATNKNWDWARSVRLPEGNLFPCDTDYLTARYGPAPETTGTCAVMCGRYCCGLPKGHEGKHQVTEGTCTVRWDNTVLERIRDCHEPAPTFTREAEAYLTVLAEEDAAHDTALRSQFGAIGSRRGDAARAYLAGQEGR